MRTLFETENLIITVGDGARDDIWVTFGYFGWNEPFGINYLSSRGQAAVYVVSKPNHWFQHEEIHEALAAVRAEIADVTGRRILYGSSMGAFAAIAFSGPLAASHVIAAAPQVSISRAIVGNFDNRWIDIGDLVKFEFEDARASMSPDARICVLYDNLYHADKIHATLLAEASNVELYAFPAAGHSVLGTLQTAALLKDVLDVLLGPLDQLRVGMRDIRSRYRSARSSLSLYYHALGEYYHDAKNEARAVEFYAIACQRLPLFHDSLTRLADNFKSLQLKMGRSWLDQIELNDSLVEAVLAGVKQGLVPLGVCVRITHDLVEYGMREPARRLSEAALQVWPNEATSLRLASWLRRLEAQVLIRSSYELARQSNIGKDSDLDWDIDQIYSLILLNQPDLARALLNEVRERYPSDDRISTFLRSFPAASFLTSPPA